MEIIVPRSFNSLWTQISFPAAAPVAYVGVEALGKSWVLKRMEKSPEESSSSHTPSIQNTLSFDRAVEHNLAIFLYLFKGDII